ncbi:hypothetical protein [Nocardioides massiliensis]|uniref:Uncharacterized protein n=1 Tax=Nocardioides massiliensis TaxID=1325935 RepID=A0ABT9NKU6_9ACTN|nr:hypothetical protein [Nocardioides massiliensis]MDP9821047.1 hypothetical protein [Nocardioides massiliensis]
MPNPCVVCSVKFRRDTPAVHAVSLKNGTVAHTCEEHLTWRGVRRMAARD